MFARTGLIPKASLMPRSENNTINTNSSTDQNRFERSKSLNSRNPSFLDTADSSPSGRELSLPPLNHKQQQQQQQKQQKRPPMAPPRRPLLPKEHFSFAFSNLRTQNYHDPTAGGPRSHTIRTLAWNPTGQLIATGSADRTLRIWNPERPHVRYSTELRGHTAGIEKAVFNPVRDAELASCSTDGTVRFWDVRSNTCVSRLDVGGEAFTLSWSADGNVVMVGRMDNTLIPISVNTPSSPTISTSTTATKQTRTGSTENSPNYTPLKPRTQPVQTNATSFSHHLSPSPDSPDLTFFATTGDGTVKIMTYPSFDTLHTLHAHTSACLSVSLAPTARYLAIGGSDALISLWDTTDWVCRRTVSSNNNGGAVRDVSWSFDGRFLCGACDEVGGGANGLEIFHAESGESVYTVPAGGGSGSGVGIPAVAWHPSRYWLAYSTTPDGPGTGGLRIVGAAGGGL